MVMLLSFVAIAGCTTTSTAAAKQKPTVRPARGTTTTSTIATSSPTSQASTATTSAGPSELVAVQGHVIVVDAGHNGGNGAHAGDIARSIFIGTQTRACDTTGTQTAGGYTEHAFTLQVALRVRDLLTAAGAHVVMVRTDDTGWGPCIDERAAIGNRAHAEAGISIHADGGPPAGHGFHVNVPADIPGYTGDIYAASHALGVALRDVYASETGIAPSTYIGADGLVERSDFGGLNLSDVPKVLFETANMQNPSDAALLQNPDVRERIAHALAAGLARYFSSTPRSGPPA